MNGVLYNIIYSEKDKTIRFHHDRRSTMKLSDGERLICQVEGVSNAMDVMSLITTLRPDLTIIDNEIDEFEID